MDDILDKILSASPEQPLSTAEAASLMERWPAFILPALVALRTAANRNTADIQRMATLTAISLPGSDSLRDILGDDAQIYANFYPQQMPKTPSTTDTIDTFLATYGTGTDPRETDILTKAIFNPAPDYAAMLASEEQSSMPSDDELDETKVGARAATVNRFIASTRHAGRTTLPPDAMPQPPARDVMDATPARHPQIGDAAQVDNNSSGISGATPAQEKDDTQTVAPTKAATTSDPGALSESLARIMIKNHNYTKALEIISDLHLKNPEKSVYFADQIRFLRKLIVNESKK